MQMATCTLSIAVLATTAAHLKNQSRLRRLLYNPSSLEPFVFLHYDDRAIFNP